MTTPSSRLRLSQFFDLLRYADQRVSALIGVETLRRSTLTRTEGHMAGDVVITVSRIILDTGPTKEVSAELAGLGTVSLTLG